MIDQNQSKVEIVEAIAFGHSFQGMRMVLDNLTTLEKEGCVYSHFWDDDSEVFRYYRTRLLPQEIFQYVEAHIEHDRFQRVRTSGGAFEAAVGAIVNPEIVERVRSYGNYGRSKHADGTTHDIRGCPASFYPPEMELLLCGGRPDRYEPLPEISSADRESLVISAMDNFPVIRRFLGSRKHNRPNFSVENEYDTQDLLYSILRATFTDVKLEEWTPSHAGSAKRIDIVIPSIKVVIEVKHVRDSNHAKAIADELRIDIESYHQHPACERLIAFVHDPNQYIVDPEPLMSDLSGFRKKAEAEFDVTVLVR